MKRPPFFAFLLGSLFPLALGLQAQPASELPPLSATYIAEGVTLSGDLADPAWNAAEPVTGFIRRKGRTHGEGTTPDAQTTVRMLYDNRYLYFGVHLEEPEIGSLRARFDQDDLAIHSDDCFEVVFDTRDRPETFYHFVVNPLGAIYDARNGDEGWSHWGAKGKAKVGDKAWTVELAIPFEDLGIPAPVFGESWGMRLCRERKAVQENSALPPTADAYFTRSDLGRVVFRNNPQVQTPLKVTAAPLSLAWGLNHATLTIANESTSAATGRVVARTLNEQNEIERTDELPINVAAGKSLDVRLPIPLRSDRLSQVSITLENADSKPVWGMLARPGFEKARLPFDEARLLLPSLKADLLALSASQPEAHKKIEKRLTTFETALLAFDKAVATAEEAKQVVPGEKWETLRKELDTFQQWLHTRDYVVWEVDPWAHSSPRDLPAESDTAMPTLHYEVAGNEREPRAIQIAGLLAGGRRDLRLAVSDFHRVSDPEAFVSRDHFHIYHAPWVRDGFNRLITDPLVESAYNGVTVTPGQSEKLWVVFDSRGVAPGQYKGVITVKPLDTQATPRSEWREIPFEITVHPFTLPETDKWPIDFFFFGPGIVPGNEIEMLRLYHAYHINWMMTNRFQYMYEGTKDGTVCDGDPEGKIPRSLYYNPEKIRSNDDFLREAKRLNMRLIFGWNTTRNLDWYKEMVPYLDSLGYIKSDYAFQGLSDEFHSEDIPKHIDFHRAIHKQDPELRFMATLTSVPPPGGPSYEELEEPTRYVNLWIQSLTRLWPPGTDASRKSIDFFRQRGGTVWAYTCRMQMVSWPVNDYYRMLPWRGYIAGLDGVAMWAAMSARGDGWDHGDGYDEGILYRGLNRAPVPTKRLEAIREGLEDVAYMHRLKEAIAAAEKTDPNADLSAEKKLIETMPLQIQADPQTASILAWRKEAAAAITRLIKK